MASWSGNLFSTSQQAGCFQHLNGSALTEIGSITSIQYCTTAKLSQVWMFHIQATQESYMLKFNGEKSLQMHTCSSPEQHFTELEEVVRIRGPACIRQSHDQIRPEPDRH